MGRPPWQGACYDIGVEHALKLALAIQPALSVVSARGRTIDILVATILVAIIWFYYREVAELWWRADDPAIIKSVIQHGVLSHFYDPGIWRQFTASHVTPWIQLSFGLDYSLYGLKPSAFYQHHLFSLVLTIVACFVLLRQFFSPYIAGVALCFFVLASPTMTIIQFLMTRHYLEGLALVALAAILYVKAVESERRAWWSVAGGVVYLLACTAKEVYVPVVVVLPFVPVGRLASRARAMWPFAAAACLYVVWRAWMLGPEHLLSGYGGRGFESAVSLKGSLAQYADLSGLSMNWQWATVLAAFVPLVRSLLRQKCPNRWFLCLALVVACLGPLIPVWSILTERYLFVPMFALSIAIAAGLAGVTEFPVSEYAQRVVVAAVSLLLLWQSFLSADDREIECIASFDNTSYTTGQFVLNPGTGPALLLNPPVAPWFVRSLSWIREHELSGTAGPEVCYDPCVCNVRSYRNVYEYQNGSMISIDPDTVADQASCRTDSEPLSILLRYSPGTLYWVLRPERDGRYFIDADPADRPSDGYFYAVGPAGEVPMTMQERTNFIVKYVAPDGTTTYSPVLSLNPAQAGGNGVVEARWERIP